MCTSKQERVIRKSQPRFIPAVSTRRRSSRGHVSRETPRCYHPGRRIFALVARQQRHRRGVLWRTTACVRDRSRSAGESSRLSAWGVAFGKGKSSVVALAHRLHLLPLHSVGEAQRHIVMEARIAIATVAVRSTERIDPNVQSHRAQLGPLPSNK